MFYPSHVLFFKVLFSNFTEKILYSFVTVLLYRKFSYLVQFYILTFVFFIEINSHWWGLQPESKRLKIWNLEFTFFLDPKAN